MLNNGHEVHEISSGTLVVFNVETASLSIFTICVLCVCVQQLEMKMETNC